MKNEIIIFNYSDAIFKKDREGLAIALINIKKDAPILRIPLDARTTDLFEHKTNNCNLQKQWQLKYI